MLRSKSGSFTLIALSLALSIFCMVNNAVAQQEYLLKDFDGTHGKEPNGPLLSDSSGNLYGVTAAGGYFYGGVAFELSRNSKGVWAGAVLHDFGNDRAADGLTPTGNLIFDSAGNLYGTTLAGGASYNGAGTVYELSRAVSGAWNETILYAFGTVIDAQAPNSNFPIFPNAGLVMDSGGNLFGTTADGGNYGSGSIFELSPSASGTWKFTDLWDFGNVTVYDGAGPKCALIFDSAGNLYGTTTRGGLYGNGTVFEIVKSASGFSEKVLYNFGSVANDGSTPASTLVSDSLGNLYGTTYGGGTKSDGTAFELAPKAGGAWTETIIHNFSGGSDGAFPPPEQLVFDKAGNLYGTTSQGGASGLGIAFKLAPSKGHWIETLMHKFTGNSDGSYPGAGVVLDDLGNLYGVTSDGGTDGDGMAYEIVP